MRTKKRWLRQILKAVVGKHFDMPWQHGTRPAAFIDLHKDTYVKTA